MDYIILLDALPSSLEKQVIKYIKQGWAPIGGASVIKDKECQYGEKWIQTMILKEGL